MLYGRAEKKIDISNVFCFNETNSLRKELLDLLLKLSSPKTRTLKNNIDSAACTNCKHPLGEQQSGLSYDLLVSFIQESTISGMHPSALRKLQKEQHIPALCFGFLQNIWVGSIFIFKAFSGLVLASKHLRNELLRHERFQSMESRKNIYPGHSFLRGQSQSGKKDQPCPFQKGWKHIYLKRQKNLK